MTTTRVAAGHVRAPAPSLSDRGAWRTTRLAGSRQSEEEVEVGDPRLMDRPPGGQHGAACRSTDEMRRRRRTRRTTRRNGAVRKHTPVMQCSWVVMPCPCERGWQGTACRQNNRNDQVHQPARCSRHVRLHHRLSTEAWGWLPPSDTSSLLLLALRSYRDVPCGQASPCARSPACPRGAGTPGSLQRSGDGA